MKSSDFIQVLILLLLGIAYLWPTIVSYDTPRGKVVFVVNIFLGWTFIGWVIALAMAYKAQSYEEIEAYNQWRNKNRHKRRKGRGK